MLFRSRKGRLSISGAPLSISDVTPSGRPGGARMGESLTHIRHRCARSRHQRRREPTGTRVIRRAMRVRIPLPEPRATPSHAAPRRCWRLGRSPIRSPISHQPGPPRPAGRESHLQHLGALRGPRDVDVRLPRPAARRSVRGLASERPRYRTFPARTHSAIAPTVSSMGVERSTRCW